MKLKNAQIFLNKKIMFFSIVSMVIFSMVCTLNVQAAEGDELMDGCKGLGITQSEWDEICPQPENVKLTVNCNDGDYPCTIHVGWDGDSSLGEVFYKIEGIDLDKSTSTYKHYLARVSGNVGDANFFVYTPEDRISYFSGQTNNRGYVYDRETVYKNLVTGYFDIDKFDWDNIGDGAYSVTCGNQQWTVEVWRECPCPEPACGSVSSCEDVMAGKGDLCKYSDGPYYQQSGYSGSDPKCNGIDCSWNCGEIRCELSNKGEAKCGALSGLISKKVSNISDLYNLCDPDSCEPKSGPTIKEDGRGNFFGYSWKCGEEACESCGKPVCGGLVATSGEIISDNRFLDAYGTYKDKEGNTVSIQSLWDTLYACEVGSRSSGPANSNLTDGTWDNIKSVSWVCEVDCGKESKTEACAISNKRCGDGEIDLGESCEKGVPCTGTNSEGTVNQCIGCECVECTEDLDCSYLDSEYCGRNLGDVDTVSRVEGKCVAGSCTRGIPETEICPHIDICADNDIRTKKYRCGDSDDNDPTTLACIEPQSSDPKEVCDDGLFCNGLEKCTPKDKNDEEKGVVCIGGYETLDCGDNNESAIATCENPSPFDGWDKTWDYRPAFESECKEVIDDKAPYNSTGYICTEADDESIVSICDIERCDAQCTFDAKDTFECQQTAVTCFSDLGSYKTISGGYNPFLSQRDSVGDCESCVCNEDPYGELACSVGECGAQCDGYNNAEECSNEDGYKGTRWCSLDVCLWGGCDSTEYCGDGIVNGPEVCEVDSDCPEEEGMIAKCSDGSDGNLGCVCQYTKASYCGDGKKDSNEECDGSDVAECEKGEEVKCIGFGSKKGEKKIEEASCDGVCSCVEPKYGLAECAVECGADDENSCSDKEVYNADTCACEPVECTEDEQCNDYKTCTTNTCNQDTNKCEEARDDTKCWATGEKALNEFDCTGNWEVKKIRTCDPKHINPTSNTLTGCYEEINNILDCDTLDSKECIDDTNWEEKDGRCNDDTSINKCKAYDKDSQNCSLLDEFGCTTGGTLMRYAGINKCDAGICVIDEVKSDYEICIADTDVTGCTKDETSPYFRDDNPFTQDIFDNTAVCNELVATPKKFADLECTNELVETHECTIGECGATAGKQSDCDSDETFNEEDCSCGECVVDEDCYNDEYYCDGHQVCDAGSCKDVVPVPCDDLIDCTKDECVEPTDDSKITTCEYTADDSICDSRTTYLCDGNIYKTTTFRCDVDKGCTAKTPTEENCDDLNKELCNYEAFGGVYVDEYTYTCNPGEAGGCLASIFIVPCFDGAKYCGVKDVLFKEAICDVDAAGVNHDRCGLADDSEVATACDDITVKSCSLIPDWNTFTFDTNVYDNYCISDKKVKCRGIVDGDLPKSDTHVCSVGCADGNGNVTDDDCVGTVEETNDNPCIINDGGQAGICAGCLCVVNECGIDHEKTFYNNGDGIDDEPTAYCGDGLEVGIVESPSEANEWQWSWKCYRDGEEKKSCYALELKCGSNHEKTFNRLSLRLADDECINGYASVKLYNDVWHALDGDRDKFGKDRWEWKWNCVASHDYTVVTNECHAHEIRCGYGSLKSVDDTGSNYYAAYPTKTGLSFDNNNWRRSGAYPVEPQDEILCASGSVPENRSEDILGQWTWDCRGIDSENVEHLHSCIARRSCEEYTGVNEDDPETIYFNSDDLEHKCWTAEDSEINSERDLEWQVVMNIEDIGGEGNWNGYENWGCTIDDNSYLSGTVLNGCGENKRYAKDVKARLNPETEKYQGICPDDFEVPSEEAWQELIDVNKDRFSLREYYGFNAMVGVGSEGVGYWTESFKKGGYPYLDSPMYAINTSQGSDIDLVRSDPTIPIACDFLGDNPTSEQIQNCYITFNGFGDTRYYPDSEASRHYLRCTFKETEGAGGIMGASGIGMGMWGKREIPSGDKENPMQPGGGGISPLPDVPSDEDELLQQRTGIGMWGQNRSFFR